MGRLSTGPKIILKTPAELDVMHQAGKILCRVLDTVGEHVKAGVSTAELDRIAEQIIVDAGASGSFKGYHGFPSVLCTSVNDRVVHGIPSDDDVLAEGDIVSVDCGVYFKGFHADSCRTFGVGTIDDESQRLLDATQEALKLAIAQAKPGNRLSNIGATVQRAVQRAGFSVVRDYTGHGIGRSLHEDPDVRNYGTPGKGLRLQPGLVLAIEPMVNIGGGACKTMGDGWTVVTGDGSRSAHFEHTVAITKDGPWVLTDGR